MLLSLLDVDAYDTVTSAADAAAADDDDVIQVQRLHVPILFLSGLANALVPPRLPSFSQSHQLENNTPAMIGRPIRYQYQDSYPRRMMAELYSVCEAPVMVLEKFEKGVLPDS